MKKLEKAGWVVVIGLALLTSVATINRFVTFATASELKTPIDVSGTFDVRYSQNPILTSLHMLSGVVFMAFERRNFKRLARPAGLKNRVTAHSSMPVRELMRISGISGGPAKERVF